MRILLTDGATRTALAVVRSLGAKGHQVMVGAERLPCLAGRSRRAWRVLEYPDPALHREAFLERLTRAVVDTRIEMVLPVTDATVHLLSAERGRFPAGVLFPMPTGEAFRRVENKTRLIALAQELGVPVPRTFVLSGPDRRGEIPPAMQFPLVVKASASHLDTGHAMVKHGAAFARDAEELDAILGGVLPEGYPVLIQERFYGDGVGYFTIFRDGRPLVDFYHRRLRERPYVGGESTLREAAPPDERLRDYATRLLRHADWFGPAMAEFKIDDRDGMPRLMEINGRFWGSLQLAIDAGVDFPDLLVRVMAGQRLPDRIDYRVGTRTWWLLGDLDAAIGALAHGVGRRDAFGRVITRRGTILPFLDPRKWTRHLDTLSFRDPRPFFLELSEFVGKFAGIAWRKATRGLRVPPERLQGVVHAHSDFSHDGTMRVGEMAAFFRARGASFLCLTEHADDFDDAKMAAFVAECDRAGDSVLRVIPGLELPTPEGLHVLALGLRALVRADDAATLVRRVREAGGVPVLAHPPRRMPAVSDDFVRALAGVEVWNVPHDGPLAPNPHAIRLLRRWRRIQPSLVAIQGADLHHGAAYKPIRLAVDLAQPEEREVLRCLAGGRFEVSMGGFRFGALDRMGPTRALVYRAAGALIRFWRRRGGAPGGPTAPARRSDDPR